MNVEIRKKGVEKGVYALKEFNKGDIVIIGHNIESSNMQTKYTVQVDVDKHILIKEPFLYVNHSCDPNTGIVPNEVSGYNLEAIKPIKGGEEITYDYATSDWIIVGMPEKCTCNTKMCRGKIKGGKYLSEELLKKYDGYLAPYLKKIQNNI